MRIAVFDHSWEGWPTGGEYVKTQLCSLLAAGGEMSDVDIVVATNSERRLRLPGIDDADAVEYVSVPEFVEPGLKQRVLSKVCGGQRDPRMRVFSEWLRQHGIDVLLSFFPPAWWRPCDAGFCCWLPDFQHLRLPQYFTPEEAAARDDDYRHLAGSADVVVLSSKDAKKDFDRFCPEYSEKARLFHFPSLFAFREDPAPGETREVRERYGIESGFLLVVNQFFAHKNHIQVIEAMGRLLREGRCPQVVMIGLTVDPRDMSGRAMSGLLERIAELRLEGRVKLLGFVPADVRDVLLRNCRALIQPSEFEGWNTSVEDAKALGRPILASDLPVHHEQCPTAFGFFKTGDIAGLAELMAEACNELPVEIDTTREGESLKQARITARQSGEVLLAICREACRKRATYA